MQSLELKQIATIARKEFWDRIRNRWVLAVAVTFIFFPGSRISRKRWGLTCRT